MVQQGNAASVMGSVGQHAVEDLTCYMYSFVLWCTVFNLIKDLKLKIKKMTISNCNCL